MVKDIKLVKNGASEIKKEQLVPGSEKEEVVPETIQNLYMHLLKNNKVSTSSFPHFSNLQE